MVNDCENKVKSRGNGIFFKIVGEFKLTKFELLGIFTLLKFIFVIFQILLES